MPSETTIHVAIELSVSSWLVAARPPGVEKSRLHRIEGGDTTALLALIAELRTRASTKLGKPAAAVCCFEAGRDGFWLHRALTMHGVTVYVLEPTSILVNRRARRAKTDRLDAEGMLRVLAAWLAGDRQVCSSAGRDCRAARSAPRNDDDPDQDTRHQLGHAAGSLRRDGEQPVVIEPEVLGHCDIDRCRHPYRRLQLVPHSLISREANEQARELERVAEGEVITVLPRSDFFRHPADIAAYHRAAMGQRLFDDQWRVLPPDRRHHHPIDRRHQVILVAAVIGAGEVDPLCAPGQ